MNTLLHTYKFGAMSFGVRADCEIIDVEALNTSSVSGHGAPQIIEVSDTEDESPTTARRTTPNLLHEMSLSFSDEAPEHGHEGPARCIGESNVTTDHFDLESQTKRRASGKGHWMSSRVSWPRHTYTDIREKYRDVTNIRRKLMSFKEGGYKFEKQSRLAIQLKKKAAKVGGLCQALSISILYDAREMAFVPHVTYNGHDLFKRSGNTIVDFLSGDNWQENETMRNNIKRYCSFLRGWLVNSTRGGSFDDLLKKANDADVEDDPDESSAQ
eukprot:GILK01010859.1.p1 GENE.GILK01010859.1~~GILK01010859.1.p1  ORF type:complete len:270 (+),score=16.84 GILK01010859.1:47-856(+)